MKCVLKAIHNGHTLQMPVRLIEMKCVLKAIHNEERIKCLKFYIEMKCVLKAIHNVPQTANGGGLLK